MSLLQHIKIPAELVLLRNIFLSHGFDIRLVGGCVRDAWQATNQYLPYAIADIDLSTNATPEQAIEIYKTYHYRYIETGLQHGTVTVLISLENGETQKYEITSLRIDSKTDGRHAEVEWTTDWERDASRRDLRMNAMSLTFDDQLIDPFDGVADLENGLVQFVGDPNIRIQEDYLRILRWFRFFTRFNPSIYSYERKWADTYEPTLAAIKANAAGLKQISAERVWSEFKKIFSGQFSLASAAGLIEHMIELGVWQNITNVTFDLDNFRLVRRSTYMSSYPNLPIAFWTALLGDPVKIEQLATEWRWSNEELNLARFLVSHQSTTKDSLELSLIDRWPIDWLRTWNWSRQHLTDHPKYDNWVNMLYKFENIACPITGHDLKDWGMRDGPAMGKMITAIKQQWLSLVRRDLQSRSGLGITISEKDYRPELIDWAKTLLTAQNETARVD